jgi:hypothetical protein
VQGWFISLGVRSSRRADPDLRSAMVSRPRRSADGRSPGDAPTVGEWESCGRRGRAGQETLPEPARGERHPAIAQLRVVVCVEAERNASRWEGSGNQ